LRISEVPIIIKLGANDFNEVVLLLKKLRTTSRTFLLTI